jgi:hypothetical protein
VPPPCDGGAQCSGEDGVVGVPDGDDGVPGCVDDGGVVVGVPGAAYPGYFVGGEGVGWLPEECGGEPDDGVDDGGVEGLGPYEPGGGAYRPSGLLYEVGGGGAWPPTGVVEPDGGDG